MSMNLCKEMSREPCICEVLHFSSHWGSVLLPHRGFPVKKKRERTTPPMNMDNDNKAAAAVVDATKVAEEKEPEEEV